MKKDIKLFITDIDGVWTNGGIYYDKSGNEFRKFNHSDSLGVFLLYLQKIPVAAFSEVYSEIAERRLKKLKITEVFLGIDNKLKVADSLREKYNITWDEIAYIGDDLNDIKLLQKVGLSAVPAHVPYYIKKNADYMLSKSGGDGVFREFVERYLDENDLLQETIEKYLSVVEME